MAKKTPGKIGRPTKFQPKMAKIIRNYCLLGATNEQLAEYLDVNPQTIYAWLKNEPRFAKAVKAGREIADAKVARSLYRRAIGYSHPDTHVSTWQGETILTELVKHYPPDTAAAMNWLKNRQPEKWRDNQQLDIGPETLASVFALIGGGE